MLQKNVASRCWLLIKNNAVFVVPFFRKSFKNHSTKISIVLYEKSELRFNIILQHRKTMLLRICVYFEGDCLYSPTENSQRFWWLRTANREQGLWFNFRCSYEFIYERVTCKWYSPASCSCSSWFEWFFPTAQNIPLSTCKLLMGFIRLMIFCLPTKPLIFIVS